MEPKVTWQVSGRAGTNGLRSLSPAIPWHVYFWSCSGPSFLPYRWPPPISRSTSGPVLCSHGQFGAWMIHPEAPKLCHSLLILQCNWHQHKGVYSLLRKKCVFDKAFQGSQAAALRWGEWWVRNSKTFAREHWVLGKQHRSISNQLF